MTKPNAQDQKLQAVLFMMGLPLGKDGIDGVRGSNTTIAMNAAASSQKLPLGNAQVIQQALIEKLKDPAFREAGLAKLAGMPPTKDTIIAQQTILAAAGHDVSRMQDPVTKMMNGRMNEQTQLALANTESGKPTTGFMKETVAKATGMDDTKLAGLFDGKKLPETGTQFASAASATQSAPKTDVAAAPAPSGFVRVALMTPSP